MLFKASRSRGEHEAALARSLVRLLVPDEVGRQISDSLRHEKRADAVEYAAALLARLSYPNLRVERVLREIKALANNAAMNVFAVLGVLPDDAKEFAANKPVDVIKKLGQFWRAEGFHGTGDSYYSDRNSYLPDVLERKTGLPIAMSIVYLAVARRLFLDAQGVNMPGHFIVRIRVMTEEGEQFVLVDPFNGARPLNLDDCRRRVEAAGQQFVPDEHLKATPAREILVRMCNNLLALFDHQKKTLEAERVATVLTHLQPRDPIPLLIRAERRLRRGDRRGARRDMASTKRLDPAGPIGRTAEEMLRRMDFEHPFR